MKNKLISLGLVAGFSIVALSSCNDYLKKGEDQVILTIGDKKITADELLSEFKDSNSTSVAAFYNAISEVLIRNATKTYAASSELQTQVDTEIERFKEKAHDSAKSNGTSYKEELNNALASEGVEDLDEYREHYVFTKLQEHLTDKYYDDQIKNALSLGDDSENPYGLLGSYINQVIPYHVRHILVNVSASGSSIYDPEISETEAVNLSTVIRRIANVNKDGTEKTTKETFGQVAYDASDDDTSAKQYGDLGIMSTKTSFVNEFKLGIYAYESLYANTSAPRVSSFLDEKNTYSIPSDAKSYITTRSEVIKNEANEDVTRRTNGIGYIPFAYTQKLEEVSNVTTDVNGKLVNDGDATYYPRNIYFTNFFNDHGINVITNTTEVGNFKKIPGLFNDQPVLCADGDTNKVVLVTRAGSSYQGVHFMVIEKSGISDTLENQVKYYDNRTASQLTKDGDEALIGSTFVTYLSSSTSETQKSRAESIETEVKGFDSMLDARIFEHYLGYSDPANGIEAVTIADERLKNSIQEYIETTRAKYDMTAVSSNEDAWESYLDTLTVQDEYASRKVSLICAGKFSNGYVEGDGCYVKK